MNEASGKFCCKKTGFPHWKLISAIIITVMIVTAKVNSHFYSAKDTTDQECQLKTILFENSAIFEFRILGNKVSFPQKFCLPPTYKLIN